MFPHQSAHTYLRKLTLQARNREGYLEHPSETGYNTRDIFAVNSTCASHGIEDRPTIREISSQHLPDRRRAAYSHTLGISIQQSLYSHTTSARFRSLSTS